MCPQPGPTCPRPGIRPFPPGVSPPALSPRPLPPRSSRAPGHFPPVTLPIRPFPPGSYTPLRIQESILFKGELSPNIWTFLKVLQKEQALNEIQITQMMAGQQAPPQRRQYRESGQRVLRIVEDFENHTAMEYGEFPTTFPFERELSLSYNVAVGFPIVNPQRRTGQEKT